VVDKNRKWGASFTPGTLLRYYSPPRGQKPTLNSKSQMQQISLSKPKYVNAFIGRRVGSLHNASASPAHQLSAEKPAPKQQEPFEMRSFEQMAAEKVLEDKYLLEKE